MAYRGTGLNIALCGTTSVKRRSLSVVSNMCARFATNASIIMLLVVLGKHPGFIPLAVRGKGLQVALY